MKNLQKPIEQKNIFEVGKRYSFNYNGKMRWITVHEVHDRHIIAFDHNANFHKGAYRHFKIEKISGTILG